MNGNVIGVSFVLYMEGNGYVQVVNTLYKMRRNNLKIEINTTDKYNNPIQF